MKEASQTKLTREQKEAVGLLSIGTFLEYFDMYLYVHMIVLLNELFFPPTDPFMASLLAAGTFSSTFILLPLGSLFFGYLGDKIGRKKVVIITTIIMSISCILIANLPTYAQIGITASIILTLCRILQAMSSATEFTGASLYLTELIPHPNKYWAVAIIAQITSFGALAALGIVNLVNEVGLNWRAAFGVGAVIAVIGLFARTKLKETREFTDARTRVKNVTKNFNIKNNYLCNDTGNKKNILSYFGIDIVWPVIFYFVYIHCSYIYKNEFDYSSAMVVKNNLYLTMIWLIPNCMLVYLVSRINPLIICKVQAYLLVILVPFIPLILDNIDSPKELFLLQAVMLVIYPSSFMILPIIFSYFPVLKRFTYAAVVHAMAKAIMYLITSFGIVILVEYWGNYGLLCILLPVSVLYIISINHFANLEKEAGRYDSFLLKNCNKSNRQN